MLEEDVRRLILTSIPSVPHLEALLLLRSEPHGWDVTSTARRLYIPEKMAEVVLHDLAGCGFIVQEAEVAFRYAPASTQQARIVDKLADAHARNLLELTDLIHRKSALVFADAFRFRKE